MKRDVGISFVVILLALLAGPTARGERLIFRNGFPLSRGTFFNGASPLGGSALAILGGRVFERGLFGGLRPLFIRTATGQLLGATRADTIPQLGHLLSLIRNRLSGIRRAAVDRFLAANGFLGPLAQAAPAAGGGFPAAGAERAPAVGTEPGGHGLDSVAGSSIRPALEITPTKPDGSVSDAACRDLNATICSANADRRNQEERIDREKGDTIGKFVLGQLAKRVATPVADALFEQAVKGITANPPVVNGVYRQFSSFLARNLPSTRDLEATVKPAELAAIAASPFPDGVKKQMSDKIRRIRLQSAPDFSSPASIAAFVENCGPTGMADGAFSVPSQDLVVVCPGVLVRMKAAGKDEFASLIPFHMLTHELGHTIGADVDKDGKPATSFRGNFARKDGLEGCLNSLKGSPEDGASQRLGESTADLFAVESMVQFMNSREIRGGRALKFISTTLQLLCDSERSPVHPSGSFRISFLLGRNPGIRSLLGCQGGTSDDNLACTFAGAVTRGGKP